ncbi:hypothetical protein K5L04_02545 [Flavobacterium psychrophilum]|uniref:Uncharacterized protein n=1 Tax=Flavobacterium psychrophilum TaxID=96345 RepID=A0A7U2NDV1_FLAPS|nr:hypothetical protein [Flavobacterium psychrophilum]EKT4549074.1 hypothetical protein [Flavobacterium psychrophilum]ELM3644983.1 hypothetical protein [Flavobacterium psychrophilum]ELV7525529.1 hypothetical protein [Flavobacterium psychrophilum]QRE03163.1 hypothetical protein H0H26_09665 [Flavobacterium psychrophilum]QZL00997.1 hypothetical protein K5L04_02545 [Flavobacterium psychrophilum]
MKFLKIKKSCIVLVILMSVSFSFAQDVEKKKQEKKQPKIICVHKGENTGCGPTRKDAKYSLKMAIEADKKNKLDSIAKIQMK